MTNTREKLLRAMTLGDKDGSLPLPDFTEDGLLPLSIDDDAGIISRQSPYGCSLSSFESIFGTTPQRRTLIEGLKSFRRDLTSSGVHIAFQWISGSFVERDAIPKDIDLVTFYMPSSEVRSPAEMRQFAADHPNLFVKPACKARYGCEPNYVLLANNPVSIVRATAHWSLLLSYRRDGRPRGFVAIAGVPNHQ